MVFYTLLYREQIIRTTDTTIPAPEPGLEAVSGSPGIPVRNRGKVVEAAESGLSEQESAQSAEAWIGLFRRGRGSGAWKQVRGLPQTCNCFERVPPNSIRAGMYHLQLKVAGPACQELPLPDPPIPGLPGNTPFTAHFTTENI